MNVLAPLGNAGVVLDQRLEMRLRFLLWIFLSMALGLAGAARSSMLATAGFHRIQICANGQEQDLLLDASGKPATGLPACGHCPDCVPSPLALTDTLPGLSPVTTVRALRQRPLRRQPQPPQQHRAPQPRGPPPASNIRQVSNLRCGFSVSHLTLVKWDAAQPWQSSGCIHLDARR